MKLRNEKDVESDRRECDFWSLFRCLIHEDTKEEEKEGKEEQIRGQEVGDGEGEE
jgi:hypothetical protein